MMTVEEALKIVQSKNERRFPHILGTYEMATSLASQYDSNRDKCQLAAIFHDYAKNEPIEAMRQLIEDKLDSSYLRYSTNIFHAPVARYYVKTQFKIEDEDILNAIEYHVTGHPEMNDVAKIVYVSDYIEKNRTHPSVDFCRYLSTISLDVAVLGVSEHTYLYLKQINEANIHPLTISTYQKFLEKVGEAYYESIKDNYKRL
jgi:predicted HD superfamily hydrolase involved in NAD metabolism